jgi:hypothetical protein
MPTKTYKALANITLSSDVTTVTFSSIPSTYRDLIVIFDGENTMSDRTKLRFNGDTGSNYSDIYIIGTGSSAISSTQSSTYISLAGGVSGTNRFNSAINIMDYSATDKHKTALIRTDTKSHHVTAWAGRWANTSAITSVAIIGDSLKSGMTFALYGIEA